MARLNAANFAESTLSAQVLSDALQFPVQTGHGSRFPTPPFRAVIYTGSNKEVIEVTSISTDTLICDNIDKRGLESTSAIQHESGSVIENAFTAGAHEELSDKVHDLVDTTNHPVSGLTSGHFLKATGASSYAFGAHGLSNTDVGAAASSHPHGDITNDGKIGSVADLVIVTGTAGALTAKTAGTSDQFLRGDGSWAEPSSGGLTDENKVQIRMFGKVI